MRRDEPFLTDSVEAADSIARSPKDQTFDAFMAADSRRDSILYRLIVIGEAVAQLPAPLRAAHPEVSSRAATAFRNRVVHGYFAVDWTIVGDPVTGALPLLRQRVAHILSEEYPAPKTPSDADDTIR